MKYRDCMVLVLGIILALGGCGGTQQPQQPDPIEKARQPAVAGLFYPQHKEDLAEKVDQLLADADPPRVKNLHGLVCPHAGYEYSGITAAIGYKELIDRDFRTVVVMAPSHYASFEGASIPAVDAYETPLGLVPLSPKAAELARLEPFVVEPECDVNRPGWWRQAPKELPAFGKDTPHSWEHSLEVQLPFLQRTLNDFSLVPIVFGRVDPEEVAKALAEVIDEKTLIVASSDLSHYHPYDIAKRLDSACVSSICALNGEWVKRQDACGKGPILTLIHLARQNRWKATLLDYRNSGDTSGNKSGGVVGYAAIAFSGPDQATGGTAAARPVSDELSPGQEQFLLELARKAVTAAVCHRQPPVPEAGDVDQPLGKPRACFVTLTIGGRLRGCIGSIFPEEPLYQAVIRKAQAAAVADPRFPPVGRNELEKVHIEVSVLTLPEQLACNSPDELLEKLRPGIDGVVLRLGERGATYLPQVWEQLPDKKDFLEHLAQKANLDASAWKSNRAKVLVYQVTAFEERDNPEDKE